MREVNMQGSQTAVRFDNKIKRDKRIKPLQSQNMLRISDNLYIIMIPS